MYRFSNLSTWRLAKVASLILGQSKQLSKSHVYSNHPHFFLKQNMCWNYDPPLPMLNIKGLALGLSWWWKYRKELIVGVLGFNATLTAKVISIGGLWPHAFPGCLKPVLTQLFFPKLFSRGSAEVKGENTLEKKVTSTRDQTHNHQVMSLTSSPLSHPSGAIRNRTDDNSNIHVCPAWVAQW